LLAPNALLDCPNVPVDCPKMLLPAAACDCPNAGVDPKVVVPKADWEGAPKAPPKAGVLLAAPKAPPAKREKRHGSHHRDNT
jgi:hypothetical protein